MRTIARVLTAELLGLILLVGCGHPTNASPADSEVKTAVLSADVLLSDEPEGALGVIELREQAKDEEEVVLLARIGGATSPWVEGRAAFAVVDASVELCDEGGGVCACCQDKVCDATALVKIVDQEGRLFKSDARDLLKVKVNDLIVVSGRAKRDDAGNLTVLASSVYVRR